MNKKNRIILLSSLAIIFLFITFCIINNSQLILYPDYVANMFMQSHQSPVYSNIMLSITKICDTPEAIAIFIVFGLFLLFKNRKSFYVFSTSVISGMVLVKILKYMIQRARPYNLLESDYSFPSSHATIATIFLLSSALLISPLIKNRFLKNSFLLITSVIFPLVAYSRIYLSVHWSSDVLAGIILGSICFIIAGIACCQEKENVL